MQCINRNSYCWCHLVTSQRTTPSDHHPKTTNPRMVCQGHIFWTWAGQWEWHTCGTGTETEGRVCLVRRRCWSRWKACWSIWWGCLHATVGMDSKWCWSVLGRWSMKRCINTRTNTNKSLSVRQASTCIDPHHRRCFQMIFRCLWIHPGNVAMVLWRQSKVACYSE